MCAASTTGTAAEQFDLYLRSHNKRRTAERFAILERVLAIQGHFSADTVGQTMRADGFPVSTATVYSTLELLSECGLVVRQRFAGSTTLYERASASSGTHHHLVCTCCGKIQEVREPAVGQLIVSTRFARFTPTYYTLNIYGVCARCARANKSRKKQTHKP